MPVYRAPVDEVLFLLNDVLGIGQLEALPGFDGLDQPTLRAIFEEGAKLVEETLQPLNQSGDREGCTRHPDGSVTTPKGFVPAYQAYRQGGWLGLSFPEEFGGQGLPSTLNTVMQEFISAANLSFGMYPGLTQGAIAALLAHANADLKSLYVPKMISGEWSGTMNLTEPQCGTDLGLIRVKATRNADGSFAITGQKIFISSGEHDLASNIIHLVLARIEGAPAGTKGISLFVCPKFIPDSKGNPSTRNALSCGKLEEKMGIHANSTCVMNYDGATAWLIGEENRGLPAMFTMMNEARLAVGVQGLAIGDVAGQNAIAYAKDRRQGRALSGAREPDKPADTLMVHPDVRRTILTIKALTEAGRALVLDAALASDIAHRSPDEAARRAADDKLGLLTPVIKGVLTDLGFEHAVNAQQMLGGHGFIAEWGMEQFVRDARITMIYEGANGVQAMDLVGRKLPKDGGRAMMAFLSEVEALVKAAEADDGLKGFAGPMRASLQHLQKAIGWLMQNALAKPDNAGAGATDFMRLTGLVAMGAMWLRMAKAAIASRNPALAGKLVTCRFFMERILPETDLRLKRIEAGAETMMTLEDAQF